jgi:hypothetical protein
MSFFLPAALLGLPMRNTPRLSFIGMVVLSSLFTIRRFGRTPFNPVNFAANMVSLVLAPWVLLAALLYGSIRYKQLLIL